ncbi:uncharacterized protein Dana_GF27503 [Drosophila ananassae]|uniref:Uncharacterized protein n=1 Tax=Drosophila ananassae TaxID=7217 RepID=A0A0P8ZUT3_DROAN|nr:uncharacterized protein LOC26514912 [Drosophila ananassae]KPU78335.1 uncharacterized protein Dana_GF27503 [Drosophila ananassae]
MPSSRPTFRRSALQDQRDQQRETIAYLWASLRKRHYDDHLKEQLKSSHNCLSCQDLSNVIGSDGESVNISEGESESARLSAILCSVNSANNTRKLNLILAKERHQQKPQSQPRPQPRPQQRGVPYAVGTNLQNKLPASSADCHLSPSAETNIHSAPPSPSPTSYPLCSCPPSCSYSNRHHHHHRHHHYRYRHRCCCRCRCRCRCCVRCYIRCCCRCRDASHSTGGVAFASASASPASMLLPYQINQRATLLQHRAAASASAAALTTTATSTTLPHVPGATTLRALPRIFKRDTAETATTASPLTPQQHPTVPATAAAQAATSTIPTTLKTTTKRSRLEYILYTEVYEEEDSISQGDFKSNFDLKSSVGSETFWQEYGE